MIDHVILTVSNFERSVAFYTRALAPIGITISTDYKGEGDHPDLKGLGDGKNIYFWLKEGKAIANGVHIGFIAKDHMEINQFYEAALSNGGTPLHAPRVFHEYYPGYYAAWVLDPDGYEIEVVHKS